MQIPAHPLNTVELFTGAGGLALGLGMAGFHHQALVEWDSNACDTLRENQRNGLCIHDSWPVFQGDVRQFDYQTLRRTIDLVAGGVPCQPFSIGGKHKGHQDSRNMFPEALRAVRELQPRMFLFENVRGLLRQGFAQYFNYILISLSHPEIISKKDESWLDHLARLEQHHMGGKIHGLHYRVVSRYINAADYGIPQKRERVFIVGIRGDLSMEWCFPKPIHGVDALLWTKFGTGEYWERHRIAKRDRPRLDSQAKNKLDQLRLFPPRIKPWLTVRDAIRDLPGPALERGGTEPYLNHFQIPGARVYPGHTGSDYDEPAKTLKAGDHGVPGGENMLHLGQGIVRYFTIRESARLQTFPDEFIFPGSWTESMRQIGNAVPVTLGKIMGSGIRDLLSQA